MLWRRDKGDNLNLVMQIKNEIHRLLDARKANQQNLAQTDPDYYSLVQPTTESLISLRTKLENLNGSLLHYFVGENTTNILLVRPDSIFYKQVNFGRTYLKELIKQISPLFSNNPFGLSTNINSKNDLFRLDLAGELYKIIFEPIRAWIPGQSTLFISADDILNRVPFECLVTNPDMLTDMYDYYNVKFLVEDFDISYIPYAKFLDWPIKKQKRPQKSFIAFAGPADFSMIFLPRITSVNNPDIPGNNHSDYPLDSVKIKENEIARIAEIVGKNKSKQYSGQKSTKKRFLAESPNYRILHLALPTLIEENSPLYSKIFFSNYKDTPEFLEMFELLNLNLNAAMVVLSSSNIMAGNLNDAAGVKGLAHAFNYAGVPSMVTSLWNVNGNASFEVLTNFYSKLKLGMVKSAALQQAKVAYLQTINRNPYYWAGYILVGNPQSIEMNSPNTDFLIFIALAGVLALITVVIWQFLRIKKDRH
ncbi:MAG: CHAT domain-containing protein [bacterium]